MKTKRHSVLLIVSIGMIVGTWALLRAADEANEGIPASQSVLEEQNPLERWQEAFILVDTMGPPLDPCGLLHP